MSEDPKVYLIDDDEAVLESLRTLVETKNLQVECHSSPRAFLGATVRGLSIPEIAAETKVSERTVQFRRSRLMQTIGAGSRKDLLELVLKSGWNPETSTRSTTDVHSR